MEEDVKQHMIETLRQRVMSLIKSIEESEELGDDKDVALKILSAINAALLEWPIDDKKLAGNALGILKIWEWPGQFISPLEYELYDLVGEIDLLVRKLRQAS